jgi:hypothetical protein
MMIPEFGDRNSKAFSDMAAQAKQLGEFQESLARSFDLSGITKLTENFSNIAKLLEENTHAFTRMLKANDFKVLLEPMGRQTPYNYEGLLIKEQFKLIDASRKGNYGTVEVLPKNLVTAVLDNLELHENIDELLLDGFSDITEQASNLVDAYLDKPLLAEYGYFLGRAIETIRAGHYEASQTLSTALWDSFLCEKAGRKDSITATKQVGSKPDIEIMESFSPLYDYGAYGPAISAYTTVGSSSKYSRNGTIHHLSRSTANKLNSLKSLTIATGVLGRAWRQIPTPNQERDSNSA